MIEPYNEAWVTAFNNLQKKLHKILEGLPAEIQHVGSTSIPGVWAKPIIDLDIIIEDKSLLDEISVRLQKAGYINKGEQGIPGRFAFKQLYNRSGAGDWPEHHLYVCYADCLALKNHLLFRDALLRDQQLAQAYTQLKIELASDPSMTRDSYNRKKTGFILAVLSFSGLDESELDEIRKANI